MIVRYKFIIFFISSIFLSGLIFAQQTTDKADTTQIYKNIESYSSKSNFTKFIYWLIFKPIERDSSKSHPTKKRYRKFIQKPYRAFEGKIIRNIKIVTLDPFGYSVKDTAVTSQIGILKAANSLHIKSLRINIRNLLLIRENQPFDSLLVKESERLVRTRNYVNDVLFYVYATQKNSDSVDILIQEQDNWSLIPGFSISPTKISVELTDKNFLGLGHEFRNDYSWFSKRRANAYKANYFIPNIRNTFINSTLNYSKDEEGNDTRSFAVDRPFFSPFARWAAGIEFFHQFRKDSIYNHDQTRILQKYKFNSQDYWVGNSIQIFKGNTEYDRTTNFISAIRYLRIRYNEKPDELYDTLNIYGDEIFYLAGIGISTRNYVQDKYIFKYGVTEDVPVGRVFSITGGYQIKNKMERLYLGARISSGHYYPWGYLSSEIEYGTFFRNSHAEQGAISAGLIYFTGVREIGKWKLRQFIKPSITIGLNRFSYDSLTIKETYGLDGFNSTNLTGTKRLLLTLQTQSYAPWNLIGFHFGPFLNYSIGLLGDDVSGFRRSKLYSLISLGVLIRNENLVISTFQLSISFYPLIPGVGQDVYKINSIKTTDLSFRDFEIGKPAIISFR